ncbi:signal recognition particle protein [Actinospica sp. MGRD01-02]|uniref:Signal recognition particle protein n=1 Tax=Actinospica acidithermotolerans TaxID=2828514 RepID=A0A941IH80_9ACTN|nr:signal recognition particle protein [Actinospica acidithermotolerans]MBR7824908.1 signal recognition particle protein [Actinospica acidithermotolerans]
MFDTLSDRLAATFKSLRGKGRLSEEDIDATCREIRIALLEADVALAAVRPFVAAVKERALGAEVSQALNPAQQVIKIVNEELIKILGGETRRLRFAKQPPTVIMLAGLQGAGKTTLAGKLGRWLKSNGHAPMLVAADLQRPNAVTQLQVVGERAGVPVYAPEPGNGVGDPVKVARDSIEYARAKQHDVVVIDTAGRLGIDEELMRQAADIRDAVGPQEILFVLDAMIGQDAVTTAQAFLDGVGFDGVVLTKLDGDARGGAALSVAQLTGRQVMFASNGEKLDDFDVFHPDRMASRILGMGDMLSLIEQAEKAFDAQQAEEMAKKLMGGDSFTLDDFLVQMEQIRKMGSLSKIMGMLPGMGEMKQQLNQVDDKEIDRVQAIIRSMTPQERRDPKILNGSRRARIARGSGVHVSAVNNLLERFTEAQKMMKSMGRGGIPGLPGMPGFGAGGGRRMSAKAKANAQAARSKNKSRSGNPAKRKAEEAAKAERAAAAANGAAEVPQNFELPDEFKKMLG